MKRLTNGMGARCANVTHSQPSRAVLRNQCSRPRLKNASHSRYALRCESGDAARFTCCLATATVAPPASAASAVQINFSIPYRVNFGQALCLLGSSDELGAWDVACRVCTAVLALAAALWCHDTDQVRVDNVLTFHPNAGVYGME